MNTQEGDILTVLRKKPYVNQRALSTASGHSLGIVNRSLRTLTKEGYLDSQIQLTQKAIAEFHDKAPKNAVILAAGYGMRMIPINTEMPKGLLEINGEPLIERIIHQLHEAGITQIYVVVGFMKEQYEYLIDEYDVELVFNPEYTLRNNLHSLRQVLPYLSNTYIVPCDIWCAQNPFSRYELYSWYMVSDSADPESSVRINRKMELVSVTDSTDGNAMVGIAYLLAEQSAFVRKQAEKLCQDCRYNDAFWEETLYQKSRMIVNARVIHASEVVEINTYEQLRELDSNSSQLKTDAIDVISKALGTCSDGITDITVLKKGMTNRSFLFSCNQKTYIMRIPGEGTERLINRAQEASVYHVIAEKGICDDIVYINPDNGYKITEFLKEARVCNPLCETDVCACMKRLREFHEMNLKVNHEFDLFHQISFYESLWNGTPSIYKDYKKTKENVFALEPYIKKHRAKKVLTHIDAVPDNFLLYTNVDGSQEIRLIDWEYAGMQDPHVDLAMFCIYSLYDRQHIEKLIQAYFPEGCRKETKVKIYCYIAVCGLLWSNWCEYKRNLGIEFGEYSLRQYRYAKDYYRIVQTELEKMEAG